MKGSTLVSTQNVATSADNAFQYLAGFADHVSLSRVLSSRDYQRVEHLDAHAEPKVDVSLITVHSDSRHSAPASSSTLISKLHLNQTLA
jgi:hypothetical protein